MKIKLTVAVPVYNVENYLKRCLDSLIDNQIENYEILLVDDGSTDRSGNICDEYAEKYDFIRVIHQKNKGLAEVRNVCIQNARGEYISFIDSDDFIGKDCYSHLFELVEQYDADILCYGVIDLYEGIQEKVYNINNCEEIITELTAQQAVEEMLLPKHVDVITCNKIIRLSLYHNIKYPSGKLYEDMFTNYKVIAKANKVVSTNYKYYYYFHREGSIGRMKFNPKTMDLAFAVNEVFTFGKNFCEKPINNLIVGKLFWNIVVVNFMIKSETYNRDYITEIQKFGHQNWNIILSNKYINTTRKIQILLFSYCFNLYKVIYKKYIDNRR